MKIIRERERVTQTWLVREFLYRGKNAGGFSFDCDRRGNPAIPTQRDNFQKCVDGTYDVVDCGIVEHRHTHVEPAVGLCPCGCQMFLDGFTNTCGKCGRDYNMSGQELAPRCQWGEETGEYLGDILRIG